MQYCSVVFTLAHSFVFACQRCSAAGSPFLCQSVTPRSRLFPIAALLLRPLRLRSTEPLLRTFRPHGSSPTSAPPTSATSASSAPSLRSGARNQKAAKSSRQMAMSHGHIAAHCS